MVALSVLFKPIEFYHFLLAEKSSIKVKADFMNPFQIHMQTISELSPWTRFFILQNTDSLSFQNRATKPHCKSVFEGKHWALRTVPQHIPGASPPSRKSSIVISTSLRLPHTVRHLNSPHKPRFKHLRPFVESYAVHQTNAVHPYYSVKMRVFSAQQLATM